MASLINGNGGAVFGPGTKPTLNAPANEKAMQQLQAWNKAGFMPAEPSVALITSLFNEGKAAMVFSGPWFLGEIAPASTTGWRRCPASARRAASPCGRG